MAAAKAREGRRVGSWGLLGISFVVGASACGDELLASPNQQCDELQVSGLTLRPYPNSSDPAPVEGPATVMGAGPYELHFDSGEVARHPVHVRRFW
jgi:hypothetical protein